MDGDPSSSLPFLVTNWLTNFSSDDPTQEEAVNAIRRAAADLSTAFASLGSFGTRNAPVIESEGQSVLDHNKTHVANATFADARRTWSTCPPDHLVHLVQSSVAAGQAAMGAVVPEVNPILQATQAVIEKRRNPDSGGRTLQDAITLEDEADTKRAASVSSTFQRPVLLDSAEDCKSLVVSQLSTKSSEAADKMRLFLDLRDKCTEDTAQIRSIQRSLEHHRNTLAVLNQQRAIILAQQMDPTAKCTQLDEIKENEQNCNRVIAQLQRQLTTLERSVDPAELTRASQEARTAFRQVQYIQRNFRDPGVGRKSRILTDICSRQAGYPGRSQIRISTAASESRRAVIFHRLSHTATINSHLHYPVYCLRFDRTGRYFITGADDYLVRVYCMGSHVKTAGTKVQGVRGAILVCTLRGHAAVINNIDVSPDNAFLATASEDGDVRVWGLKDGSPIAILRGHKGGANTVVWSATTPSRLVTAGGDGLARCWDIREACLKRYSKVIGKRPEYQAPMKVPATILDSPAARTRHDPNVALPPIPVRLPEAAPALPLPPLPPAGNANRNENAAVAGDHAPDAEAETELGRFVANDAIDEGVKLLRKLQHGALQEEQVNGPGTRSRRSVVKVLCVARCPYGNHFATGSDDGVCRIWRDDGDLGVDKIDRKFSDWAEVRGAKMGDALLANAALGNTPLLTLKGNLSAITDLQYSSKGDRILSASQKDGVVRIWSWTVDPALRSIKKPSNILIKLSNPRSIEKAARPQTSRRRPTRAASNKISCDVAVWTKDDSMVITSQSELEKQSGSDILPDSQYIFLWDSYTGDCLMGIAGAHSMQCPVLIPHTVEPAILCTAGADGCAKLWDLASGKCISKFENTLEFGPMDIRDKGKPCGFLDGEFSPDGMSLVLTDDNGRVCVFDCSSESSEGDEDIAGKDTAWIREQYFANDYYDLHYDQNGYCVERGSELPPHLAPRGVRCSNSGSAWAAFVNDAFRGLVGPLPLNEEAARWARQNVRVLASRASELRSLPRGNFVGQFDPQTTVMFGESVAARLPDSAVQKDEAVEVIAVSPARVRRETSHRMSNNYRWRDYSDLLQAEGAGEDEMEVDDGDEDFEINEPRGRTLQDESDDDMDMFEESPARPASRRRRRETGGEGSPTRHSARQRRRTFIDTESESESEEEMIEWMSTNNTPSGPFVADYDSCHFRVPDSRSHSIERLWVRRLESNSSYGGRKSYTPQVGDSVIYVPQAHYETISVFPTLGAPWQNWPDEAAWPVVKCCVRNVRYRFPFKAYFGRKDTSRSCSIVAILTLEISGIPELSHDRSFPWPKPSFITPTRKHVFELSLFETGQVDFVIPTGLYTSRLKQLEDALASRSASLDMEVYYNEGENEDSELQPFLGRVDSVETDDSSAVDSHLIGSGFRTVSVVWEQGEDDHEPVSPWEVSMRGAPAESDRPYLTDEEKRCVRDALKTVRDIDGVEGLFVHPVNQDTYTDYRSRIEVPMDMTFISSRLEADYYSNVLSVVADVKLIRDNCIKYNGENHEFSALAKTMLAKFEESIINGDELESYRKSQMEVECVAQESGTTLVDAATAPSANTMPVRQSVRQRTRARSSLENLSPPPAREARPRSETRLSRAVNARPERSARLAARSVLESAQGRTLEDISGSSRGRASQNSGSAHRSLRSSRQPGQQSRAEAASGRELRPRAVGQSRNGETRRRASSLHEENRRQGLRSADPAVARRGPVSYADQPSDADETDGQQVDRRSTRRNSRRNVDVGRSVLEQRQSPASLSRAGRAARRRSLSGHPSGESGDENSESENEVVQHHRSRRTRASTARQEPAYQDLLSSEAEGNAATSVSRTRIRIKVSSDVDSFHDEDASVDESSEDEVEVEEDDLLVVDESDHADSPRTRRQSSRRAASTRANSPSRPNVNRGRSGSPSSRRSSRSTRKASGHPQVASSSESPATRTRRSSRNERDTEVTSSPRRGSLRSRTRGEASSQASTPDNEARKRRRVNAPTYEEPDSSDFDSDDAVDEEEDASPPPTRRVSRKSTSSKKVRKAAVQRPKKRIKASSEPVETKVPATWPEIERKQITGVAQEVLERLRGIDAEGTFSEPVAETYPDMADDYLKAVEEPMDFRTIEEERMPRYRSIAELQQDLLLVFYNCLSYNDEPGNELAELARTMLDMLHDIFVAVCNEQNVLLPRRWDKK